MKGSFFMRLVMVTLSFGLVSHLAMAQAERRGGDRGSDRGDRGSDRGDRGSDRDDRWGDRGSDRGDRGSDRGDRGSDRGDRGDRGSDRGDRWGDRGDRGDHWGHRGDRWSRNDDWRRNRHRRDRWDRNDRYRDHRNYRLARSVSDASDCFDEAVTRDLRRLDFRHGDWLDRVIDRAERKAERVVERADELVDELRDHDDTDKEARKLGKAIEDFRDLVSDEDLRLSHRTLRCLEELDRFASRLD